MSGIKNYLSLIKFSHTIFAMPFAMIGFFLGFGYGGNKISGAGWGDISQLPSNAREPIKNFTFNELSLKFLLVILCMIFARSAAMAFNRYLDRNFDKKNPRTAIREIPKGIISANSALVFTVISCVLFLVSCFFINKLCFYLSPVALFVVLF